jgi:hypothetical protein
MWLVGIFVILMGADMVIRGERSVVGAWWYEQLQQQREIYNWWLACDSFFYLRSVLLFLFPWLIVWLTFKDWLTSPVLGIICISGSAGSLYLWYRVRHLLRALDHRYWQALYAGRLVRWLGVGYFLIGALFVIFSLMTAETGAHPE